MLLLDFLQIYVNYRKENLFETRGTMYTQDKEFMIGGKEYCLK